MDIKSQRFLGQKLLAKGLKAWVIIWKLGEFLREDEKKPSVQAKGCGEGVVLSLCDDENWDGDVGTA